MIIQYLPHLASKNIVLASASPRRLQLLQLIGMSPKVVTSNFEENLPKTDYKSAAEYAIATSKGKALEVAKRLQDEHQSADLVIGSDTVVEIDGDVLEKPADANEAASMLNRLSNRQHQVHTGVTLILSSNGLSQNDALDTQVHTFSETTAVQFGKLSDQEIAAYIATGETYGKAGAYGIQGAASVFVKSINGDYFNVMGFPLHSFSRFVAELISKGQL